MESNENEPETIVPRFLDELELIERKRIRLDSRGKERWSLTDKKEDNQVLAEMGVALLDGNVSPDDDTDSCDGTILENIENQSPNLRTAHCYKKSFIPPKNSPKSSPNNKNLTSSGSTMSAHSKSAEKKIECLNLERERDSNFYESHNNSKTAETRVPELSISNKLNTDFLDYDEDIKGICTGLSGEDVCQGKGDRKRCSEMEKCGKKARIDSQAETASTSQAADKMATGTNPVCQASPHTTCSPHPALHCPRITQCDTLRVDRDRKDFTNSDFEREFDNFFDGTETFTQTEEIQPKTIIDNVSSAEFGIINKNVDTKDVTRCETFENHCNVDDSQFDIDSASNITHRNTETVDDFSDSNDSNLKTSQSGLTRTKSDFRESDGKLGSSASKSGSKRKGNDDDGSFPLSSVDQVILESADSEDLEQTIVHGESDGYFVGQNEEKECFTAHDRSFCTSCDNSSHPSKCSSHDDKSYRVSMCEDDEGGMFAKLSDEVVLSVFQWLPKRTVVRCMHVCRRWRRLAADGRLWARVDLGGRVLPSGALPTLMERHPVVLRLALAQLVEPVLPTPVQHDWRIQYLDLSAATVSPACLTDILSASPGLVRLSLEALALDRKAAQALGRLTQLRALNLSQATGLQLGGWKALGSLPRLEHLNLAWAGLREAELRTLATQLPAGLQRLNLAGCRKTLKNDVVAAVVDRCPRLVELDLSDAATIGGEAMQKVRSLQSLEHLAVSRCYMLQLKDYLVLEKCPSLQWVDAFGLLPPLTVTLLQRQLPHIQFNKFMHSSIARPTVGNRRTSIWGLRTRD